MPSGPHMNTFLNRLKHFMELARFREVIWLKSLKVACPCSLFKLYGSWEELFDQIKKGRKYRDTVPLRQFKAANVPPPSSSRLCFDVFNPRGWQQYFIGSALSSNALLFC